MCRAGEHMQSCIPRGVICPPNRSSYQGIKHVWSQRRNEVESPSDGAPFHCVPYYKRNLYETEALCDLRFKNETQSDLMSLLEKANCLLSHHLSWAEDPFTLQSSSDSIGRSRGRVREQDHPSGLPGQARQWKKRKISIRLDLMIQDPSPFVIIRLDRTIHGRWGKKHFRISEYIR